MSSNYNQDTTQALITYLLGNLDAPENVNLEKVNQLLIEGANPNGKDEGGNTVLEYACEMNSARVVKELIKCGAQVEGHIVSDDPEIQLLVNAQKLISHLRDNAGAPEHVKLDVVRKLLIDGANPNGRDAGGSTVLEWACQLEAVDVVRELIARGAEIGVKPSDVDNTQIIGFLQGNVDQEMMDIVRSLGESYFVAPNPRPSQSRSSQQDSPRGPARS